MAFEACDVVKVREAEVNGKSILLEQTPHEGESVAKTLSKKRKESEVGPSTDKRRDRVSQGRGENRREGAVKEKSSRRSKHNNRPQQ